MTAAPGSGGFGCSAGGSPRPHHLRGFGRRDLSRCLPGMPRSQTAASPAPGLCHRGGPGRGSAPACVPEPQPQVGEPGAPRSWGPGLSAGRPPPAPLEPGARDGRGCGRGGGGEPGAREGERRSCAPRSHRAPRGVSRGAWGSLPRSWVWRGCSGWPRRGKEGGLGSVLSLRI